MIFWRTDFFHLSIEQAISSEPPIHPNFNVVRIEKSVQKNGPSLNIPNPFQIKQNILTAESFLGDLTGFRNYRREATELKEQMLTWVQDTFDDWSREMQSMIDDPNANLRLI